MSTETSPKNAEKQRSDRLVKTREKLQEAMRKDIQALNKIIANVQQKKSS